MRILNGLLLSLGLLAGCDVFPPLALAPREGAVSLAGTSVLLPPENSALGFAEPMQHLLERNLRLRFVEATASGEHAAMTALCANLPGAPDIVLLTRSPALEEINRCERAGHAISADLIAFYAGGLRGAPAFTQLWIAFDPQVLAANPAADRAVRALRYDFGTLIEGTEYQPYFTARRG